MRRCQFFCLIVLLGCTCSAQESIEWGLDFLWGFPQEELQTETDESGFGIEGSMGFTLKRMPLTVGVAVGYLNMGHGITTFESTEPAKSAFLDPGIDQIKTSYDATYANLFFRMFHDFGFMEPYIEGFVGYQRIDMETVIDFTSDPQTNFTEDFDNSSPSFGVGGGVSYFIFKPHKRKNSIQLTLGARYSIGTDYDFLVRESLTVVNNAYEYRLEQKNAPVFTVKAGFRFIL